MGVETTSHPAAAPGTARASGAWQSAWVALALAALTLAVFWPVRQYEYVYCDDNEYVFENEHVLGGVSWDGVAWAFHSFTASNWHPVTWLSHMLDVSLFGRAAGGAHLTNVLLHAANAVLLFLVLARLTGMRVRAWVVAALFAVHPLHVESVAWVSERKDVLSGLFFMLTVYFWTRGWSRGSKVERRESRAGRAAAEQAEPPEGASPALKHETLEALDLRRSTLDYVLALCFFALGLMSKPMLVTLPFVLLLLDYWPLRRFAVGDIGSTRARLVWEKVPFLALSAGSCLLTLAAQRGAVQTLSDFPLPARLGNAAVAYARYLGKTFWPADLALPYPYPAQWPVVVVLFSGLVLAAVSVVAVWMRRGRPWFFVGWFWFVGMLVPVIGLVQVGAQSMADRYTYLPLVGIFVVVAWVLGELAGENRKRLAAVLGTALVAACVYPAAKQVRHWRNSGSLFSHALAVTENNDVAHSGFGVYLRETGRAVEAEEQFRAALRINPHNLEALGNLGSVLRTARRHDEAIGYFETALSLNPGHARVRVNYGHTLLDAGRVERGLMEVTRAVREHPEDANLRCELGKALARAGRTSEALAEFEQALRVAPGSAAARYNRAVILQRLGRNSDAIAEYRFILKKDPGNAEAHHSLGVALTVAGSLEEAAREYSEALRLKPRFAEAHSNLGYLLAERGALLEALAHFQEAVALDGKYVQARYNLGWALSRLGRTNEAIACFRETLRLAPGHAGAQDQLRALGEGQYR